MLAEIVPLMSGRLSFARETMPLASNEMVSFVLGVFRMEILGKVYYVTLTAIILWQGYVCLRWLLARVSLT